MIPERRGGVRALFLYFLIFRRLPLLLLRFLLLSLFHSTSHFSPLSLSPSHTTTTTTAPSSCCPCFNNHQSGAFIQGTSGRAGEKTPQIPGTPPHPLRHAQEEVTGSLFLLELHPLHHSRTVSYLLRQRFRRGHGLLRLPTGQPGRLGGSLLPHAPDTK